MSPTYITADDSERQALLPDPSRKPPPLRKPRGQLIRSEDFTQIICLPWLTFALSAVGVGMIAQDFRWLIYAIASACLANALLCLFVGFFPGHEQDRQGAAGAKCIGLLCIVGLAAGWTVGLYADGAYMDEYWRLSRGLTYDAVPTSGLGAAAHADASGLNFERFTFVDTERSLGYMEKGQVYCAAPITGQAFSNSPLYYAVGLNCCDQRGNFKCGQADPNTVSAVVVNDTRSDAQFQTAIRVLESVYSMVPSKTNRITVKVVLDAGAYQGDLWRTAILSIFCATIVAGFIFILVGLLLRKLVK